ncbi:MAG: potassium-transporting ATPase subunit F [Vicinamibacterales bacterium]
MDTILFCLSVAVASYLLYAMLRPERF